MGCRLSSRRSGRRRGRRPTIRSARGLGDEAVINGTERSFFEHDKGFVRAWRSRSFRIGSHSDVLATSVASVLATEELPVIFLQRSPV